MFPFVLFSPHNDNCSIEARAQSKTPGQAMQGADVIQREKKKKVHKGKLSGKNGTLVGIHQMLDIDENHNLGANWKYVFKSFNTYNGSDSNNDLDNTNFT
ncbi:hypothetical protein XENOCAPTIV_012517 [Xenoophorus captivus]|uniref:Uncharacterized protein n=1 Tax=Xenoophorus captivus TaxID=1517983 RepID=A0ABV0SAB2_9TELE